MNIKIQNAKSFKTDKNDKRRTITKKVFTEERKGRFRIPDKVGAGSVGMTEKCFLRLFTTS
ncbi:hypothetical protein M1N49_02350, partial [Thermodesulfovibrionales bacterium]|nr:hypothetical protein [Thermodesulfovibrionales bacterium]